MSVFSFLGLLGSSPTITPDDAHARCVSGEIVIIDVRQPEECSQTGRPGGSVNVSLSSGTFIEDVRQATADYPDIPIALSCRFGSRSKTAARRLLNSGMDNIQIVKGGIVGWKKSGLPVDS